ncbi:hypothetical protein HOH87_01720 [bacterium]|jgi:hypothetical protein|nr:hypothetical protein [bacterium]
MLARIASVTSTIGQRGVMGAVSTAVQNRPVLTNDFGTVSRGGKSGATIFARFTIDPASVLPNTQSPSTETGVSRVVFRGHSTTSGDSAHDEKLFDDCVKALQSVNASSENADLKVAHNNALELAKSMDSKSAQSRALIKTYLSMCFVGDVSAVVKDVESTFPDKEKQQSMFGALDYHVSFNDTCADNVGGWFKSLANKS